MRLVLSHFSFGSELHRKKCLCAEVKGQIIIILTSHLEISLVCINRSEVMTMTCFILFIWLEFYFTPSALLFFFYLFIYSSLCFHLGFPPFQPFFFLLLCCLFYTFSCSFYAFSCFFFNSHFWLHLYALCFFF